MLYELPVVFTSDGAPLAGTLVRNSASLSARQRCVVVTGSWLSVKEQMALVYARALAERGFTAFTYDFSGWGESGGALRHWELRMAPAYAVGDERAGMFFELDYYANPARGAVKEWSNQMAETSWLNWFSFDGLDPAPSVTTPTLLVHSDGCAFPDNAKTVHARLAGKKQLAWIDKGTQTDFYDVPEYVNTAADRAAAWFVETL